MNSRDFECVNEVVEKQQLDSMRPGPDGRRNETKCAAMQSNEDGISRTNVDVNRNDNNDMVFLTGRQWGVVLVS
jgi:hypothetical protein